jgi:hypothetical protein
MYCREGGREGISTGVYVWKEVQFAVLFVTGTDDSIQLHVGRSRRWYKIMQIFM